MSPTTVQTDIAQLADHAARIKSLEEMQREIVRKLDQVQWMLIATLGSAVAALLAQLVKH
jgi:predicted lysophospholipase L1 biosynthesis ABC-type transport system permease subunit